MIQLVDAFLPFKPFVAGYYVRTATGRSTRVARIGCICEVGKIECVRITYENNFLRVWSDVSFHILFEFIINFILQGYP